MFQNCTESYELAMYSGLGTPLHSAVDSRHSDMVETALLKGADPLIKDSTGRRAIDVAEYYGLSTIIRLLLASGSPPSSMASPQ